MADIRDKIFMNKWNEYMACRDHKDIMFALHPGTIISAADFDKHYIGVTQLARLYNIPTTKWVDWDEASGMYGAVWDDYFHLFPSHIGYYNLPREVYDAIK